MRKITAALFAFLLLGALAGCSSDDSDDPVDEEESSQAEPSGTDGSEGSDDGAEGADEDDSTDEPGDDPGADPNDGSNDDEVSQGDPVSVPSDLVDDISEMAAAEDEDVTDEEAACIAEMMVIVLGEEGARDAISGGIAEVDAAMDEATDGFSEEATRDMLVNLSEGCQVLMTGSVDVDGGGEGAPAAGPEG